MARKFTAAALLLALTLILTLACSGGDSLTVEEYAQLVCEKESGTAETWGDLVKSTQEGINTLEGINPPDEMRDYHNALTTTSTALIKFTKSKPQGETINPFELIGIPEVWAAITVMENLPGEIKETLQQAGCDLDEDSATTEKPLEKYSGKTNSAETGTSPITQQDPTGGLQTLRTGETPTEGQWYYSEEFEENAHSKIITMVAPRTQHQATYECTNIIDQGYTYARTQIRYPHELPKTLPINGYEGQPATIVNEILVPLMWQWSRSEATDIKLIDEEARILVQHLEETESESYQISFAGRPQMDVRIPSNGLDAALREGRLDCFTREQSGISQERLKPPSGQQAINGWYGYQSPDGKFSIEYPSDCGQMWESQTYAETIGCKGNKTEISSSVELYKLSSTARNFAEGIATHYEDPQRYSLTTNEGHELEIVEIAEDHGRGLTTSTIATFADENGDAIVIDMIYWSASEPDNRPRVEETLKTLSSLSQ